MLDLTVRALAWILTLCTPRPRGRHRLGALPPLRYLPTPPPRHLQRARRRAAWLATLGIDVGPTCIHGVHLPAGVTR
ncbi:hypothetical protein [Streptomyces sp. NPDC046909]|uniref:hypothetical protein n=1 Tax=Streptomyces sp. NPDC046909 TaxID=3155617 RepID=UPI0033DE1F04